MTADGAPALWVALEANDRERRRLVLLVASLDDAALAEGVHGRWTVAAKLAHLAYWDRFALALLELWAAGEGYATDTLPDFHDDALERRPTGGAPRPAAAPGGAAGGRGRRGHRYAPAQPADGDGRSAADGPGRLVAAPAAQPPVGAPGGDRRGTGVERLLTVITSTRQTVLTMAHLTILTGAPTSTAGLRGLLVLVLT